MYSSVLPQIHIPPLLCVMLPVGKALFATELLGGDTHRTVSFEHFLRRLASDIVVDSTATVITCYFIPFLYHNSICLAVWVK